MATITSSVPMNIVEAQKRAGFTNAAEFLGELAKKNDLLRFLPFLPANKGFYHEWLEAVKLGAGSWAKANSAIARIASVSDLKREEIFYYEGESVVDERILEGAEDKIAVRDSEDVANVEGFIQGWLSQLFYAAGGADSFKGLSARRATPDGDLTFDAGGSGNDCTSLWLFEFGENGFNLRYPKNAQPGFINEDKGLQRVNAPDGTGQMNAWVRLYKMIAGLQIKQSHALLRMGSIETTGTSNIFDPDLFIKMKNKLPSAGRGAVAFANRTLHAQIESDAYNKSNAAYTLQMIEEFGPVAMVCGIPVMMAEAILDTEDAI